MSEEEVLLGYDDHKEGGPVREDAEEVGEDLRKVLAAGDARDGVYEKDEECPGEAGNLCEGPTQSLY